MIKAWLAQLGIARCDESQEAFILSVVDGPEIIVEREVGAWLMAARVGPCPSDLSQGTWLVLLQINGPFSPMLPFHITTDTRGEILLWVRLLESEIDIALLTRRYEALQEYYAYLHGLLYKDKPQDVPNVPRMASGAMQFV